ncbi:MAG: prolyl oligopeptidase family serine peptidase [Pseudomonadota bacterium]
MPFRFRLLLCTGVLALMAAAGRTSAADAARTLPPIDAFFENARFSAARIAPDGHSVALKVGTPARRDSLIVIDLDTMRGTPVAYFDDADIGDFDWVNSRRLVFDMDDRRVARGMIEYAPGLFAVDRDGKRMEQLVNREAYPGATRNPRANQAFLPRNTYMLGQSGAQKSDAIYVARVHGAVSPRDEFVDLLLLDTVSALWRVVPRPPHAKQWLLDQWGDPRIVVAHFEGTTTTYLRDTKSGAWNVLESHARYAGGDGAFTPLAFTPDGNLLVQTRGQGDKAALHTLNIQSGKLDPQPLLSLKDFDFDGEPVIANGKLLGVHIRADAESSVWYDPAMKAAQADVDAKLPNTVNRLDIGAHSDSPWLLVSASSDVQPRVYLVYNTADKSLSKIGESHPRIAPAQMGRLQLVHYKARDGMDIPAWLTLPAGPARKGLPMVVLVHGGPYLRGGSWTWDPEAQFLASRGYAVLEPEFRGSTGYGWRHFRAGWKQWGLKMQDDIADGTRWAIGQGYADAQRICIGGASYGGYAALMGLVNDPGLYRCAIDWVGVTDIALMVEGRWTFRDNLPEEWKEYGIPELVGDVSADAAQFKATSPLQQAARITQPLLLAYGGSDRRVPAYHGKKFYDAVSAVNKQVEWVEYPGEGHGWALPATRIDFWGRVEKFLAQQIGGIDMHTVSQ